MSAERDLRRLQEAVTGYGTSRAWVAFSGGVDSSVVTAVAARALGMGAVEAVTAVSASFPAGELEAARATAASIGVAHRTVATGEVERDAYARNDVDRCYHCKAELYGTLRTLLRHARDDGAVVLAGANADDLGDVRPGLLAAEQQGVRNPLLEQGLGKADVRAVARVLGLAVADKPALACLSSRVAFGIRITPTLLGRIDHAEGEVRALGFDVVRVRHLGPTASVEVPATDVARLVEHPGWPEVRARLVAMGWPSVSVDARGYRQGSLNLTVIG